MELHIVSDGFGANTYITTPAGELLYPVSAEIHLEADEGNRIDLTFHIPSLDIRARLDKVTLVCPTCSSNMTHPCHPAPTVPDDKIYGD